MFRDQRLSLEASEKGLGAESGTSTPCPPKTTRAWVARPLRTRDPRTCTYPCPRESRRLGPRGRYQCPKQCCALPRHQASTPPGSPLWLAPAPPERQTDSRHLLTPGSGTYR